MAVNSSPEILYSAGEGKYINILGENKNLQTPGERGEMDLKGIAVILLLASLAVLIGFWINNAK